MWKVNIDAKKKSKESIHSAHTYFDLKFTSCFYVSGPVMGFLDSGMVVVLFITMVLLLVTGLLLFYDFKVDNLSFVSFFLNKIGLCCVLYMCAIAPLHCMKNKL